MQYPGKLPFVHASTASSVDPSVSPSITLSLSAEQLSKIPSNNGEKHAVNYLNEITVLSLPICTSYGMSVTAPICALSIPSVHTPYGTTVIVPVHASSIPSIHTLYVPSICTSYVMSVVSPVSASPVPSGHLTNDERQEFPDEFPGTNNGEKLPSKITAKIPDDITLSLHQAKFLVGTPGITDGVKYPAISQ